MSEKYFSIIVKGDLSAEAEEGELDKNTGIPKGPTTKIKLQVGMTSIPNFSKVWAKRVMKGPKGAETTPTGELEFLKWNTPGGEVVPIRYIEGIKSLDRNFQRDNLKIVMSEEESNQSAFIDLEIGVNDFDVEVTDPMFIEMLKHHTYCEDNTSRNPNTKENHFAIYNPKKLNAGKVDQMRRDQKANAIIMSGEEDSERLAILAILFELDPRAQNEVLFNELLEILDASKQRVLDVVAFHQARFTHLLTKLEDAGDLEYNETDVVLTIDHDRKKLNTQELPTANKKVYLVDNMLDPDIYAIYKAVEEVDKKLLEALN